MEAFRQAPMLQPIRNVAGLLVQQANDGNNAVRMWINWAVDDKGVTTRLHKQLDDSVGGRTIPQTLVYDEGEWQWGHQRFAYADDELLALGMVRTIMENYWSRLRRCLLPECGKYFLGDPRSSWCSTRCGSTARMRLKRRRDRRR